jgi:hypothetical protein
MTLTDPTGGAGYAFGEVLPSADMTTIATQQPDALDIVNGGTYTAGTVTLNTGTVNVGSATLDINASGTLSTAVGATVSLSSAVSMIGALTATGDVIMSGTSGRLRLRVDTSTMSTTLGTDTWKGEDADIFIMASLTGNMIWDLESSTSDGSFCMVVRPDTNAHTLQFGRDGGATLLDFPSGQRAWAIFANDGSDWRTIAYSSNATVTTV